jgi:hypothetical protein
MYPAAAQMRAIADGAGLTEIGRSAGLTDAQITACLSDRAATDRIVAMTSSAPRPWRARPASSSTVARRRVSSPGNACCRCCARQAPADPFLSEHLSMKSRLLLLALPLALAAWWRRRRQQQRPRRLAGRGGSAPAGKDWTQVVSKTGEGFVMGNPNAPIKLVEYGSRLCPACGAFAREGYEPLTNDYVKSGRSAGIPRIPDPWRA